MVKKRLLAFRRVRTRLECIARTLLALTRSFQSSVKHRSEIGSALRVASGVIREEQKLIFGIFWTAAVVFWGGVTQLTAEHDGSEELFQQSLDEPIRISVLLLDRCDVMLDRDCVIIFDNEVEVAVPWLDARVEDALQAETPGKAAVAPIRPVARDPLAMPAAMAEVETEDH